MSIPLSRVRNFCIIAHVDHGKTTLSDRLLQTTKTVSNRVLTEQHLDSMDLERERGITIKNHPVNMRFTPSAHGAFAGIKQEEYALNLIDTPGHVDFSYEVSRSLAACEGALLLVDAAQGIEAQTVANAHLAMKQGMTIIPVINKIDLPSANVELCKKQLEDILAIPAEDAILASGKSGIGIDEILAAIIQRVPPPKLADYPKMRALIFDSQFDSYQGVICYVRVFSGTLKRGDVIKMLSDGAQGEVLEVGGFYPHKIKVDCLETGMVGYIVTNFKTVADIKIGDTITHYRDGATDMLPGFQPIRSMVFSGVYPIDSDDYEKLKASMGKLRLNDAALNFTAESSVALGFGYRCGFLGLLNMEVIIERLRREYDLDILSTYPSVVYKVRYRDGHGERFETFENPLRMPQEGTYESILEPMIKATILIPNTVIGDVLSLIMEKRGTCTNTETLDANRVMLSADLPLNEILVDFNDRLKSITSGYGSMDYEMNDYRDGDMVRLDIMVNGEPVEPFATIVHRSKAEARGRTICEKLKEILPPQLFKIAIQAGIGSKVIARETISALRKDVLAKCYGGDISRKKKLLKKQQEGKKKMKQIGKVSIPQEVFVNILKTGN
jgi:GTP-binding protein LepA